MSASISGTNYSKTFSVYVPRVANGEYFLENRQKEQYAHIDGSLTANRDVIRHNFTGDNNERWEIKLNNQTGYYTIKSIASGSTPYYLQVLNNSTTLDQIVVVNTYSGTLPTGMQWKFELTANGSYKILPKSGESNGYVLSTGSTQTDLRQGAYVDNTSYLDEWYLISKCDLTCVGIQDDSHESCDHTATFVDIRNAMLRRDFVSFEELEEIDNDMLAAKISMSRIVVTNTHGTKSKIILNDSNFTISQVNSLQNGAFDNTLLVLFVACETGKDGAGANNLVNATHDKGVEVVIGFEKTIYCFESDIWVREFFEKLGYGHTIETSIIFAKMKVRDTWESDITTDECYAA